MDSGPTRIILAMAERRIPAVTFFRDREQHPFEWTRRQSKLGRWAPIPIRIIVGYGFMAHGYSKLVTGPEHFAQILRSLGVSIPGLMGWITIVVELVGDLAVLMGALYRWSAFHWQQS